MINPVADAETNTLGALQLRDGSNISSDHQEEAIDSGLSKVFDREFANLAIILKGV
jgi:hypothetical protein